MKKRFEKLKVEILNLGEAGVHLLDEADDSAEFLEVVAQVVVERVDT
jgi:hypothetical protein